MPSGAGWAIGPSSCSISWPMSSAIPSSCPGAWGRASASAARRCWSPISLSASNYPRALHQPGRARPAEPRHRRYLCRWAVQASLQPLALRAHAGGSCIIDFYVEFEFRSAMLQKLIGVLFHEAVKRMVAAFRDPRPGAVRPTGGRPDRYAFDACFGVGDSYGASRCRGASPKYRSNARLRHFTCPACRELLTPYFADAVAIMAGLLARLAGSLIPS